MKVTRRQKTRKMRRSTRKRTIRGGACGCALAVPRLRGGAAGCNGSCNLTPEMAAQLGGRRGRSRRNRTGKK